MRTPGQPTAAPANGSLLLLPHELGTTVEALSRYQPAQTSCTVYRALEAGEPEDTMSGDTQRQTIEQKLRSLPPERVAEVEDFIDFLRTREADRQLTRAGTRLAEGSFRAVWDNPDDADYDRL